MSISKHKKDKIKFSKGEVQIKYQRPMRGKAG